MLIIFMILP